MQTKTMWVISVFVLIVQCTCLTTNVNKQLEKDIIFISTMIEQLIGNITEPDIVTSTSIVLGNVTHEDINEVTDSYNWKSPEQSIVTPDENSTTAFDSNSTNFKTLTDLELNNRNASTKGNITEPDIVTSTSIGLENVTHEDINELTDSYNWTSSEQSIVTPDENATSASDRNSTTLEPSNPNAATKVTCKVNSDCLNGGRCTKDKDNNPTCVCKQNFGGSKCEVILPCVGFELKCRRMRAVCVVAYNRAACKCPVGTSYNKKSGFCIDICDDQKCLHGKCEVVGKTFKCNCDHGYTGSHCDEKETETNSSFVPWFTVVVSVSIFVICLLIGMFCVICQIKRKMRSS